MSFEDIPEDKKEGFPCPRCDTGNVSLNSARTLYMCDNCSFEAAPIEQEGVGG